MYICKETFQNSDALGSGTISLTSDADKIPSYRSSNHKEAIVNYLSRLPKDENYYSFIIGDNGVGKTTLLNYLSSQSVRSVIDGKVYYDYKFSVVAIGLDYQTELFYPTNWNGKFKCHINAISFDFAFLFMLHLNRHPEDIKKLNSLLNVEILDSVGRRFSPSFIKRKDGTHELSFPRANNVSISRVVYELENPEDDEFVNMCLTRNEGFTQILCSGSFVKHLTIEDFKRSRVYQDLKGLFLQLKDYYKKEKDVFILDNLVYNELVKPEATYKFEELTFEDITLMSILQEAGLVSYNIYFKVLNKSRLHPLGHLSSGQKQIVKLFSLLSLIPENVKEDILFLYDEPELSLHPKWQLEFPEILDKLVRLYNIKNSHFIIATHSPLIVMRSKQLKNSSVVKLYRDESNNKLKNVIIDNLNQYNLVNLLLDEFDFSYYTASKLSLIREKLYSCIQQDDTHEDQDLLQMVDESIDIRDSISKLYNDVMRKR